ncbi:hypothetical protein BH10ACI3_BH10ACI3_21320 [soil metagenome]
MDHNHGTQKRITIERISVTTIRKQKRQEHYFCRVCGEEVEVMPDTSEQLKLGENLKTIDVEAISFDENETT